MSEEMIDWSNAPEGATHYAPDTENYAESFMKLEDDTWYAQGGYDDNEWIEDDSGDDPSRYIPRPSTAIYDAGYRKFDHAGAKP